MHGAFSRAAENDHISIFLICQNTLICLNTMEKTMWYNLYAVLCWGLNS